jgi:hypothetical protein
MTCAPAVPQSRPAAFERLSGQAGNAQTRTLGWAIPVLESSHSFSAIFSFLHFRAAILRKSKRELILQNQMSGIPVGAIDKATFQLWVRF